MKKWFKSRTIWVNILGAVAGSLAIVDNNLLVAIGIKDPAKYLTIIGAVVTLSNLYLRTLTTKPITRKRAKKEALENEATGV